MNLGNNGENDDKQKGMQKPRAKNVLQKQFKPTHIKRVQCRNEICRNIFINLTHKLAYYVGLQQWE